LEIEVTWLELMLRILEVSVSNLDSQTRLLTEMSWSLQTSVWIWPRIRLQPSPSTSLPIHYQLIIPHFNYAGWPTHGVANSVARILCSPLKVYRSSGETSCLHLQGWRLNQTISKHDGGSQQSLLVTCSMLDTNLDYSSTLKMKAICSSGTSVNFERTTRHFIPEGRTLHNLRRQNITSNK
jgi:hypothetical protein